jgi:tetratricopeptide (TPR) repeat protein
MDRAAMVCLAVPAAVVFAYLGYVAWTDWSLPRIPGRDWSLAERLLSEPRALWHYLWRLALPRAGTGGLYADAFPASRGWLMPWTTGPAFLALCVVTLAAILLRKRAPIACFAWCFFLVGHLLESTTIPLELYFEHRNYVPAMFLGWPVADALLRPASYPRYRAIALGTLLVGMILLTQQRALIWGDARLLNEMAARTDERSARAQFFAALETQDARIANARIRHAQQLEPQSLELAIGAVAVECNSTGRLDPATLENARHTLATAHAWNYRLAQWLQDAPSSPVFRSCAGLGLSGLASLLEAAEANANERGANRRRDLLNARGRLALAAGQPDLALHWFDAVLEIAPDPDYALVQAAALGEAGAPALGVRHLDTFSRLTENQAPPPVRDMPSLHARLLTHYGYYRKELDLLKTKLQAAATVPPSRRTGL